MIFADYYRILGVTENSTTEQIKSAFRKLAQIYHPDKNNNAPQSQARFIVLFNAYSILSNSSKRKEYDTYIHNSKPFQTWKSKDIKPKLPGRPDDIYKSNEELVNHFNFLLWDIEDLMSVKHTKNREYDSSLIHQCVLAILVFIDKWVLEPAGYGDYFAEARKLKKIDPTAYTESISKKSAFSHRPFAGISDYFYNIRLRMDKYLNHVTTKDLFTTIPGYELRLIDCILEAQNYTIHHLSYLYTIQEKSITAIPPFEHSHPCF